MIKAHGNQSLDSVACTPSSKQPLRLQQGGTLLFHEMHNHHAAPSSGVFD
jgi:hypothetical protein